MQQLHLLLCTQDVVIPRVASSFVAFNLRFVTCPVESPKEAGLCPHDGKATVLFLLCLGRIIRRSHVLGAEP